MKEFKLGIIGHFGNGEAFLDGQTVKTKVLYDELFKNNEIQITCVDTYWNKINKAKLLWESLKCIWKCDTVIILLSSGGMSVYFPMLYYAKKLFKIRVFHDVIGGNLDDIVKRNPRYVKYLQSFDENWVEFNRLKDRLEELNINNCCVIPNFKRLDTTKAKLALSERGKRSFCMFSRVMKEKGITLAIEAVKRYNDDNPDANVNLDIWGPIDDSYKEEFYKLLDENSNCVFYNGKVNFDKSIEVLTDHLALLFPTFWHGEGFPGTIIDAYASALPVIASDWNANKDLVKNFETGFVYPVGNIKDIYDAIEWAVQNKNMLIDIRENCLSESKHYGAETQMDIISKKLLEC